MSELVDCFYSRRSMYERTVVHFADNPVHILEAYADSGEGVDRAGGFAIQVWVPLLGAVLGLTQ